MLKPGSAESELEGFSKETETVPNAYLIPTASGQKANSGDIVLTWLRSGSGMERAIVVDDANPGEPTARYLGETRAGQTGKTKGRHKTFDLRATKE